MTLNIMNTCHKGGDCLILFLILLVLLAIAGKMFLGMALEAVGAVLGVLIVIIIFFIKRRRKQ